jgi:catechol-2,3-dioxygenase
MTKAYATTIGHAHLKVRDQQHSIDFYIRFLGLHTTEIVGNHNETILAALAE